MRGKTGGNRNQTSAGDGLELANSQVRVQFQGVGRALALLQVAGTREGFICMAPDLYSLELTSPTGVKRTVGSAEAIHVESRSENADGNQCLVLIFTHRPDSDSEATLLVKCSITLAGQAPDSDWCIDIENATGYAIQKIKYPLVVLEKRATASADSHYRYSYDWNVEYSSALLLGLYDGTLIPEPLDNIPDGFGWMEEHPGRMSTQLVAYYDLNGGLCVYTKDGVGNPKLLGFRRQGSSLDISPTHLFPREYGTSVHLSYAVTLAPFEGDWPAGADVYKSWASTQDWTRVPLTERADVPPWVKAGYPFLIYSQTRPGLVEHSDSWEETLPRQVLPVLKAYEGLLGSPLGVVVFGWEKLCSWITPDVFPPYPNEEDFRYLISELKKSGSRVCLYNSGTRWAVKNPRDPAWDGTEYWEREGRQASCVGEDGEWTYDSRPWAVNHKLCIAAEGTQKMMDRYVAGFTTLGVDAIQYDQNLGGETYVCYDNSHGHPLGYGRWMYDGARQMLRRFLSEARKHNPDFATSVEEPNEVLIPDLTFYDGRVQVYHGWPLLTNMLCVGVPLFSYLYHEYAIGFAGDFGVFLNGPSSELVKIGRILSSGYLILAPLMAEEYGYSTVKAAIKGGEEHGTGKPATKQMPRALTLLKNASQAIRTYAQDFLVLGRMLVPPSYEAKEFFELTKARAQSYYNDDRVEYIHPESATVRVPVVLCSAWFSQSGSPALVFVNISDRRQKVDLSWSSLGSEWQVEPGRLLALENLEGITSLVAPLESSNVLVVELPGLQVSVLKPAE